MAYTNGSEGSRPRARKVNGYSCASIAYALVDRLSLSLWAAGHYQYMGDVQDAIVAEQGGGSMVAIEPAEMESLIMVRAVGEALSASEANGAAQWSVGKSRRR
jgi:hypothetical protein